MSKKLLFLSLTTLAVALTGCGLKQTSEAIETPIPTTTATVTEEKEATEPVKVVHALGETEVPRNPKNVVVFDYGTLDALDTLGVEVIGVAPGTLPDYLEKYKGDSYVNVGELFEPNLEKIYELEPELIIIGGRQADFYDQLSEIAPTISMSLENEDYLGSFKKNMNYLGQIFNKEEEVAKKLEEVDKAIEEVSTLAKEKDAKGLIVLANDTAISVYGEASRFGIIHQNFGVTPVDTTIEDAKHGQKATFEYIVEKNPEYIFVIDRTAVAGGATSAEKLFENELMKNTDAYKNNRIIYLNPQAWYVANGGFISTQIMIDEIKEGLSR
ncbi:ABC transporter [Sporanaerobium hydrogeniformans]|uniref:ABC transporter n=1 Tax=Sporanaerobium hydrogeniformans TaxID=3072179 RepID=A0AC61D8G4_9FIRM|nr:siderophore ABC transporter substrate-binding protein [Sporanaerobium hydrogeniformans]PHV69453.1 ABC transporter [Sporanaerobium hydrogeniformans]